MVTPVLPRTKIRTTHTVPPGWATLTVVTRYAQQRPSDSLDIEVTRNGDTIAASQVSISAPLLFDANDCLDIGTCLGRIHKVHVAYT